MTELLRLVGAIALLLAIAAAAIFVLCGAPLVPLWLFLEAVDVEPAAHDWPTVAIVALLVLGLAVLRARPTVQVTQGGEVALAPPCPCGGNIHLVDRPDVLARKRVGVRRAVGCPEHPRAPAPVVGPHGPVWMAPGWRPACWVSAPGWPFRWPWGTR